MPVSMEKKETTRINITLPSGSILNTTLYWSEQDQDAEFIKMMVEYADGTADNLRQQNRELKEALLHESRRQFYDEREKIELDFPEI